MAEEQHSPRELKNAWMREYSRRPSVKARASSTAKKAYYSSYYARPEVKARQRSRRRSQSYREKKLAYMRKYNAQPHVKVRIRQCDKTKREREHRERPWLRLLAHARERAKKRGLSYALTAEWAQEHWSGCCELTGLPFADGFGKGKCGPQMFSPSIDRKDSSQGYTPENSRFVLWCVNSFKQRMTDAEMYLVAEHLIKYRSNRGEG